MTNVSEASKQEVLEELKKLKSGGGFMPPSLKGTVIVPGFMVGATWSAASFDPESGVLFLNANNVPNIMTLVKSKPGSQVRVPAQRISPVS